MPIALKACRAVLKTAGTLAVVAGRTAPLDAGLAVPLHVTLDALLPGEDATRATAGQDAPAVFHLHSMNGAIQLEVILKTTTMSPAAMTTNAVWTGDALVHAQSRNHTTYPE